MEHSIRLSREDVNEFVNAASRCDFDIDVFYNRVVIDAKSILGILSMDLNRVLTVRCHGEDAAFTKAIRKFMVA
jgi:phosphocarrier protein HPr